MTRENLIKTRQGTSAEWASANPTLADGEPGFETDTLKFKIGDGVTAWNSLKYTGFDGGSLDEQVITGNTFGSITLTDFFDTTKPMVKYQGVTGTTITVPPGYDYAIYIDSQGNVTQESVTTGQILTFKSNIIIGNRPGQIWACQSGNGNTPGCVKIAGIINPGPGGYPSEAACQADCCQETAQVGGNGFFYPRSQLPCDANCQSPKDICENPDCHGGSARVFCNGTCCKSNQVCVNGACCDQDQACAGTCCPDPKVCGGYDICCPRGSHCGGICCGSTEICIVDNSCCPAMQVYEYQGIKLCCPEGQQGCGSICCPQGKCCNGTCCPEGQSCCGYGTANYPHTCCPDGKCCGGKCCSEKEICCNGSCCDGQCVNQECQNSSSSSSSSSSSQLYPCELVSQPGIDLTCQRYDTTAKFSTPGQPCPVVPRKDAPPECSSSSSDSSSSADSSSSGDGSSSTDYYPQIFKKPTSIFSWENSK